MLRVSDLRHKDIINILDGRRLGYIRDVDIDLMSGQIKAVIVPGETRFFAFFSRNDDIIVPWEQIVRIGLDVILVELDRITPVKRAGRYQDEEEEQLVFSRLPHGAMEVDYDEEMEQLLREQEHNAKEL